MEKIQPARGTKDLFGAEYSKHEFIVKTAKNIAENYNYQGLTTPIFEFSNVFKRSLGETSDVVGKEMYSFVDKGGDEITLRPEFTAAICRAYISNGLKQHLPLKLFTYGPLFRHERPQHGRQRQFHQLNYEFLGQASPAVDAEVIATAASLLSKLGILEYTSLELNSLGCAETRKNYQQSLIEYFKNFEDELSQDSKNRLHKNPLRILDSKDEKDRKIIVNAPKINEYFSEESKEFFESLQKYLKILGITFNINHNLVRGLDYYNHTAFEFITDKLGAQGTVLGGGRYNGLIKLMGGEDTPGIGFAAGVERISLLLNENYNKDVKRYCAIIPLDHKFLDIAVKIANDLRKRDIPVIFDNGIKFDKSFKNAVKAHSKFAIFIGAEELKDNSVKIKNLDDRTEEKVTIDDIYSKISRFF